MPNIFEVEIRGRLIHLTTERWSHIIQENHKINDPEEIKVTLVKPVKVIQSDRDQMSNGFTIITNKPKNT